MSRGKSENKDTVSALCIVDGDSFVRRLQMLDCHCYETMKKGYQETTMRNLRSQALVYNRFCEFYGLPKFPATAWQMVRFARYVANTVTSYETVQNYLSGVRTLHKLGGFEVPGPDEPNVRHLMRAIKQELAHPIKQAEPMTPQLLRQIYEHVDLKDECHIVCYTALLVGFCLFLRKSNLVPEGAGNFNPQKQLTRADVRLGENIALVMVRWTKTIQYKEKELVLPLLSAKDLRLCPIFWLKLMCKKVVASDIDPLFSLSGGSKGITPLTYEKLARQLKLWVQKTGKLGDRYTLHGLRRGGACHALEVGLMGEELKILGDWATDAYMRYLDLSLQKRVNSMVQFMHDL